MTRHNLMLEGPDAHPTRYFHSGSVKWENKDYGVTLVNKPELVGRASDFQRDEEGWISAEIEWLDPRFEDLLWDFGLHVSPEKYYYGRKQRLHITECAVNIVMVALSGAIPHGLLPPRE